MYEGWTQVAAAGELTDDVNPVSLGGRALLVVRSGDGFRAFDAICPHRGANLGYGGRRDGDVIVCPFHGRRVHLGLDDRLPYCVREYRTFSLGSAVFVLADDHHENGFVQYLQHVAADRYVLSGPSLRIGVPPEYVIENVFDADHFQVVHGLPKRPLLTCRPGDDGELVVEGEFELDRPNRWQSELAANDPIDTLFTARVFSPHVVAAEVGSRARPNVVVTAATPEGDGRCVVRVLVAMPRDDDGAPPRVSAVGSLMNGTLTAFEQDRLIWEHLDHSAPPRYEPSDDLVVQFRRYCERFRCARSV